MKKKEVSWARLVESVTVHRDVRARYFKPTCLIAVCNLLDNSEIPLSKVPAEAIIDEFERLIASVFPLKKSNGWRPMWHLQRDGAWTCKKGGTKTSREVFAEGKPRSRSETLKAVDSVDCANEFSDLWGAPAARDSLRSMMGALMLSDQDLNSNLVGEFLLGLRDYSPSEMNFAPEKASETPVFTRENFAKFRVHRAVERNKKIPADVKKLQGYSCLVCGFNFFNVYGILGKNYIEAHHVVPISENIGSVRTVDLWEDFVVLCANCHRMIHRLGPPWGRDQLNQLKNLIGSATQSEQNDPQS